MATVEIDNVVKTIQFLGRTHQYEYLLVIGNGIIFGSASELYVYNSSVSGSDVLSFIPAVTAYEVSSVLVDNKPQYQGLRVTDGLFVNLELRCYHSGGESNEHWHFGTVITMLRRVHDLDREHFNYKFVDGRIQVSRRK